MRGHESVILERLAGCEFAKFTSEKQTATVNVSLANFRERNFATKFMVMKRGHVLL